MDGAEIRRLRSPIGEMVLYGDGVIVHTLDEGAVVDEAAAAGVLEATESLAQGSAVGVVVDLRGVAFANTESRSMFATDTAGGVEVATALVAGPRVSRFLASQFVKRDRPGRPTELFSDPVEAREWAAERVRAHRW